MKNKGSIQLSMNFIVVIVISMVILSLGIVLVKNFFRETQEEYAKISQQQHEEIINSLRGDNIVSIPFNSLDLRVGETDVVGVGILNLLNTDTNFRITVEDKGLAVVYIDEGKEILVKKGSTYVESVAIGIPDNTPAGAYNLKVKVEYFDQNSWQEYKSRIIYITVQ